MGGGGRFLFRIFWTWTSFTKGRSLAGGRTHTHPTPPQTIQIHPPSGPTLFLVSRSMSHGTGSTFNSPTATSTPKSLWQRGQCHGYSLSPVGQVWGPGVSVSRKRLSRFLGWGEVRAAEREPDSSKVATMVPALNAVTVFEICFGGCIHIEIQMLSNRAPFPGICCFYPQHLGRHHLSHQLE